MTIDASRFKGVELIVAVDVSYSMDNRMENVEKECTRMQFVQTFLTDLCEQMCTIDPSGIEVVFFGKSVSVWTGVDDPEAVAPRLKELLTEDNAKLRRGTATAAAISAVYDLYQGHIENPAHKATVCLFLTDGDPTTRLPEGHKMRQEHLSVKKEVESVINTISTKVDDTKFGISMCQVGADKTAADWLRTLDDMSPKHDIIDRTSFKELMWDETIDLAKLCHKALAD
jgi:Mg-chelatase subunit ChlD